MSCGACERARQYMPKSRAQGLRDLEARRARKRAREAETNQPKGGTKTPSDGTGDPK